MSLAVTTSSTLGGNGFERRVCPYEASSARAASLAFLCSFLTGCDMKLARSLVTLLLDGLRKGISSKEYDQDEADGE